MKSRLEKLLHDYAAGDLDAEARREAEQRLAGDPAARALYEDIRAAHEALASLRDRPEPPVRAADVLPAIQAAIRTQGFAPRPRLYLEAHEARYYRRMALAATLLLAVAVGALAVSRMSGPAETPRTPTVPPAAEKRVPAQPVDWNALVERGRQPEGIPADEYFEILDRLDRQPHDMRVNVVGNVVPAAAEER